MWFYLEGDDWIAFINTMNSIFANGIAVGNGWCSLFDDLKIVPLPGLEDQIPGRYLARKLSVEEAQDLDRYMGGDGTFTVPANERGVPWLT